MSLGLSFSIFFSKLGPFFLGGFSRKQPSVSRIVADDPPPLPLGEGGPLKEVSRDRVLVEEEQREELLLVSWSSVALAGADAEAFAPAAVSLRLLWRPSWPSLSELLELLMEQTSWNSLTSHRDNSWGLVGLPDKRRTSALESRRRHLRVCLS